MCFRNFILFAHHKKLLVQSRLLVAWLVFTLSALICYNLCMLAFVFCRKNLTHPHQFLLETNCLVKSASYRYMYIQANKNVLVSQILLHSQINYCLNIVI